jgi:PTH1 family peptidyl-tRNA hydrolase
LPIGDFPGNFPGDLQRSNAMRMIVGLGNPGDKYAGHRHNIGFMAADAIFRRHSFSPWRKKFKAEIAEGEICGEKILLLKPQTMMNLSGQSVGEAMRFYKLSPTDITVLYDELDLAPGKLRIKIGGGAGGHNGIRSIDEHCGKDYKRMRLGIGHPGHKDRVTTHVLGDFAKVDRNWLDPLLDTIADEACMIATGDDAGLMNKVALALGEKSGEKSAAKPPRKAKSHIHQARGNAPKVEVPTKGPMADMLKKLFGNKE